MNKFIKGFIDYAVRDRKTPVKNREHVGQNMMILSIFLFFVFIINFVIIIGTDKKFGVNLSEGAKSVYQETVTVQAKRGTIYDRNGIAIAIDSTTYSIYAVLDKSFVSATGEKLYVQPSQFDTVASILNKQLKMKKTDVIKQLKQKGLFQVSFGTTGSGISYSKMTTIRREMEKAKIKGVAFTTSPGRMYPNGTFASELIGLASLNENKDGSKSLVGKTGLESSMNDILSGRDGTITYEKDKNGNTLLGTGKTVKKAVDGKDVYTTISEPIQTFLEAQMDVFQKETKGVLSSATLVNAKTGEILATSQRPSYNADTLEGLNNKDYNWKSALYQNNFEPGSTMKVMTLASSIDDGVFEPNDVYSSVNGLTIADATIQDWNVNEGISTGQYMTYAQGFAFSSNVGMTKLEQKMGGKTWLDYLSKFKFGFPTRFGIGDEESGIFPGDNIVTQAMSAFGQGISVTEIQMLRAFSAIANDGVMLEPKFISKIYDPNNGSYRTSQKEVVGKPVSKRAASETRDYMVTVGTDPVFGTLYSKSTGPIIKVGDLPVAVKSGTAQIAAENGSGYLDGFLNNVYSVVAMVPSDNPDFVMYVTIQQPEHWSWMFWQDVVNPVLEEAYLMQETLTEPVPDATSGSEYKLPDFIGQNPGNTADELRRNLIQPVVLGTGKKIVKVSKSKGTKLTENKQILVLTDKFTTLPDMYGWTKSNVKKFAKWTGIEVKYKGSNSGTVIKQNIEVGKALHKIKKITITLGD
ncbi:Penicillin-binding protein 2x [Streptococcus parauberis]|uniref:Cell division protein n=1 Tax=Streptococcus parauberis KRS-02083 TaxID=1207545 RepID=A0ABP2SY91_9STRE|nr:penicillin-binding protein PBP2X [Streptococcus parauberis]AUT06692.1 Penicillin-binding protein 2x [Streptococcus parauberis]EMG25394.1 Cell division protein [Streptococcus parauberis KRS-02083]UWV10055.1 penicillin-binding protein PBP2X [Streptococcus parauberis]WEM64735.1 penicillin-binding protein PBP2X [Streptococcus parauberis]WOF46575.1 penicillin-binding protein PBP2X [Streptococcus parauberis]